MWEIIQCFQLQDADLLPRAVDHLAYMTEQHAYGQRIYTQFSVIFKPLE